MNCLVVAGLRTGKREEPGLFLKNMHGVIVAAVVIKHGIGNEYQKLPALFRSTSPKRIFLNRMFLGVTSTYSSS